MGQHFLLPFVPTVEVCDATKVDNCYAAGLIKNLLTKKIIP